jgi:hypothetical protein
VIEQSETFSLLAELALALGGFTGVAAAFGGRDRAFTLAERTRLLAIFVAAGVVLAGSLCVLVAPSTGATAGFTYAAASLLGAAVLLPYSRVIPRAYSLAVDPAATTSFVVLGVAICQLVVCVALLGGNLVWWRQPWPLSVAFSIQLLWGLYLFARILGQRN